MAFNDTKILIKGHEFTFADNIIKNIGGVSDGYGVSFFRKDYFKCDKCGSTISLSDLITLGGDERILSCDQSIIKDILE